MHWYRLACDGLYKSPAGKDLGFMVGTRLNMNYQCTLTRNKHWLDYIRRIMARRSMEVTISHLLGTSETTQLCSVSCPVLSFPMTPQLK